MAPVPRTPSLPAVPPEVEAFAAEQGVSAYLPAVLELTQRLFPDTRRFEVHVKDDPELANERTIIIEVEVPRTVEQAQEARRLWNDGVFEICSAPLVCSFGLSMDLVP